MLPPRLLEDLAVLSQQGWIHSVAEEDSGFVSVVFADVPTSHLYNRAQTEVLLRVPQMYPAAGLDMFWTSPELLLADGRVPANADLLEHYCGRSWRRFSWHRHTAAWNPEADWLGTHLALVCDRFSRQ